MHDASEHSSGPEGGPAPGGPHGSAGAGTTDQLRVIRKLLSRAESTDFEAEREACLAKVAELMARYSIEEALVWSRCRPDDRVRPVQRLIEVPAPYAVRKVALFGAVAAHHGCTVIDLGARQGSARTVAVVGFPGDVERTEVLVTSLLLQLTRSMLAPGTAPTTASGTAAWRRSFVTAYAWRVGERLREIRRTTEAGAAETGPDADDGAPSVAVVLADRDVAVEEEVRRRYPFLRSRRLDGGSSQAGYEAGRAAAERAQLQHTRLSTQAGALPR